ncbi:AAA family ATPase [Bacteroides sp.]|uniref:AAA family ATPase n=1 Tax=Bacteroides sp. TaxID=29523 RepID=UPI002610D316|nr:AAA family ATPase [Bacteroides sp.]MDD3040545.1 AAA family ATPase [Bacteroides sp.]
MILVGLLGGPSVGKSTVAAGLFHQCKIAGIKSALIQEFVREELNKGWCLNGVSDQFRILMKQREREFMLPDEIEVAITDSPTLLSFVYAPRSAFNLAQDYHNMVALYEEFLKDLMRYDLIIILERNPEHFEDDGTRRESETQCNEIDTQLETLLQLHRRPYLKLASDETTVEIIMGKIRELVNDDDSLDNVGVGNGLLHPWGCSKWLWNRHKG